MFGPTQFLPLSDDVADTSHTLSVYLALPVVRTMPSDDRASAATANHEAGARKRKAEDELDKEESSGQDTDEEEKDDRDEEGSDNSQDDEDISDSEADFTELTESLMEKEEEHELKVHEARDMLRQSTDRNEKIELGDIRGKWTLYSSKYLSKVIEVVENDAEYERDLDGYWEAGTLNIDEDALQEYLRYPKHSLGVEIDLWGLEDGPWFSHFVKPEYADIRPIVFTACHSDDEVAYEVELAFLGNSFVEVRVKDDMLPLELRADEYEVVFYGRHVETKRHKARFMDDDEYWGRYRF